jgi:hypothetical protein
MMEVGFEAGNDPGRARRAQIMIKRMSWWGSDNKVGLEG